MGVRVPPGVPCIKTTLLLESFFIAKFNEFHIIAPLKLKKKKEPPREQEGLHTLRESLRKTGKNTPDPLDRITAEEDAYVSTAVYKAREEMNQGAFQDEECGEVKPVPVSKCTFTEDIKTSTNGKIHGILKINGIEFFSDIQSVTKKIKSILKKKGSNISFSWEVEDGKKFITEIK